jgi:serine/threonine protein kinase
MDLRGFINMLDILSDGPSYKPHKYLLLLAVLDILQKAPENKIYFDENLKSYFTKYFKQYKRKGDRNRPYTPYYHLMSSGFWYLKAKPGREHVFEEFKKVGGPGDIVRNVDYAYLSEPVFELFTNRESATKIKNYIVTILESKLNHAETFLEERGQYSTTGLGKSLFKHEEEAINEINTAVKSIGKILNNIYLYDNQSNNYYEYDVILVAHSGIYVIELKHWSGHIHIEPYHWIINNTQSRTDPHKNNSFKCKILKGIYQHNFRTYPNIWVESVVVLTNPESVVDGADSPGIAAKQQLNNPTFVSISDLVKYLKKKEFLSEGQVLDNHQINAIINYFDRLNTPRKQVKYAVPGYETVEYLSQKPECIELIARPIDGRAKGLNRFRVFRTPFQATAEEKERFMKRAYSTLNTVSQIEYHPHIQKVWVIKNDYGDIIEGSDWSETGTLGDLICQQDGPFPIEYALRICHGILLGLNKAHQLGIIHRAVKPENILMFNGIPKLINFDLAYQLEENRLTVIPDASQLKDDGYIAPEVLFGEDIDESTDLFSLGVIAYEMLTGSKPFKSVREFAAQGGILNDKLQEKLLRLGLPEGRTEIIIDMLVADRAKRFKDVERAIAVFSREAEEDKQGAEPVAVNSKLQPGDKYDVYEILEQIGEGREAQIYKARTLRGLPVVLKLFNKEVPQERIFNEAEITSAIKSSYVVNCDNKIGHWKNDRFFLVLDYIAGETIRQKIEGNEVPDIETFRTVASCLMEAVKVFHLYKDQEGNPKALLHSDIKPDNIIITPGPGNKAVLIDCGIAGESRVDVFQGTNGYVPPDSIRGTDMEFSESGDIFALGVTLWEWLFGEKPYENPTVGDAPSIPGNPSEDVKAYMPWLLKAVSTEAEQRFSGIQEMQDAFAEHSRPEDAVKEDAIEKPETEMTRQVIDVENLQREGNPFVDYINSLSEASACNENAIAESQLASDFFDRIFVENPLSDFIYETLVCDNINVILTGNAGDGKTTIAADIYRRVTGEYPQILQPKTRAGDIIIVKDMSELPRQDQRAAIFKDALKDEGNRYLIVSNTGTLLESFRELKINGKEVDESELLKALEADEPQLVLDDHFMVINIANMDSIETACQVFERMLNTGNWAACAACQHYESCPISNNVRLLQDDLQTVSHRVKLLYRRLYEYDVRLTMRQMTDHLAYAITAGKNCTDINAMSVIALQSCLNGSLFFNRFFGDDGNEVIPEALQLLPVRRIRDAEFGTLLDPYFERKTWVKDNAELPLSGKALGVSNKLMEKNNHSIRRQVRRLVYFFGSLDDEAGKRYISTFLRSPMLIKFLEYSQEITTITKMAEEKYRNQILQVLQEYFVGVRLPEETWQEQNLYLTLTPFGSSAGTQMVLATFRVEDFIVSVKHRYKAGDNSSYVLCLCHKNSDVEMTLNLPFLDYISRRYEGELAEELSAHYANRLEQFKVDLLDIYNKLKEDEKDYLTLIRIRYGRGFEVIKVNVAGESLEVFS